MEVPPRTARALAAVHDLLGRLRIEFVFVGAIARAAWLGGDAGPGPIDVVALMKDEQKNQLAMMASHRGFRVEREELAATEELDLIPIHFADPEGEVRVHVLLASNALYGRIVAAGREVAWDERTLRVAAPEHLALLLAMADDPGSRREREMLIRLPEFDRAAHNRMLSTIGLAALVVPE